MPTDIRTVPLGHIHGRDSIFAALGLVVGTLLAVGGFILLQSAPEPPPPVEAQPQTAAATAPEPKAVDAGILLGEERREAGLHLVAESDGPVSLATIDGVSCVKLRNLPENYLYFTIAPELKASANLDATIEVEFYAPHNGFFDVQYDGDKWGDRPESYYSDTPVGIQFDGWPRWHRVTLEIKNARFQNHQNAGSDFRLRVMCSEFYVRSVRLIGIKESARPRPSL